MDAARWWDTKVDIGDLRVQPRFICVLGDMGIGAFQVLDYSAAWFMQAPPFSEECQWIAKKSQKIPQHA